MFEFATMIGTPIQSELEVVLAVVVTWRINLPILKKVVTTLLKHMEDTTKEALHHHLIGNKVRHIRGNTMFIQLILRLMICRRSTEIIQIQDNYSHFTPKIATMNNFFKDMGKVWI